MKIKVKLYKSDVLVGSKQTSKIKRIYHFIQAHENSGITKYDLRVAYKPVIDQLGNKVVLCNEGEYESIDRLLLALKCFTEPDDGR